MPQLRAQLSDFFQHYSPGPQQIAALPHLAGECDSLSAAFLLGYQVAMRCLDPQLLPNELAALAVNERGVRSLAQMQTHLSDTADCINGEKSHVMLMTPRDLNWIYLITRTSSSSTQLCAVRASAGQDEIEVLISTNPQPFLQALPHQAIRFDRLSFDPAYRVNDAHKAINKPFRYWEDVCVALAFSAWLIKRIDSGQTALISTLSTAQQSLVQAFEQAPGYYDQSSMQALQDLIAAMATASQSLSLADQQSWRSDSQLLQMTSKVREKIQQKLRDS